MWYYSGRVTALLQTETSCPGKRRPPVIMHAKKLGRLGNSLERDLKMPLFGMMKLRPSFSPVRHVLSSGHHTRHPVTDFYIQLENPHHIWQPGEEISGNTILVIPYDIKKPSQLTVTFTGSIDIKQNLLSSWPISDKNIKLVKLSLKLWDSTSATGTNGEILKAGEHSFPFIFTIPKKQIYTSISFEKGQINYLLNCKFLIYSNSNLNINFITKCEKEIQIISQIDIGKLKDPIPSTLYIKVNNGGFKGSKKGLQLTQQTCPRLSFSSVSTSSSSNTRSNYSCATSLKSAISISSLDSNSVVKIMVQTDSSGYLKGDVIPVTISIIHFAKVKTPKVLYVTLSRICRINKNIKVEDTSKKNSSSNTSPHPTISFRKDISQVIRTITFNPITLSGIVKVNLPIPSDSFPTLIGNKFVSFKYYIEVVVDLGLTKNLISLPNMTVTDLNGSISDRISQSNISNISGHISNPNFNFNTFDHDSSSRSHVSSLLSNYNESFLENRNFNEDKKPIFTISTDDDQSSQIKKIIELDSFLSSINNNNNNNNNNQKNNHEIKKILTSSSSSKKSSIYDIIDQTNGFINTENLKKSSTKKSIFVLWNEIFIGTINSKINSKSKSSNIRNLNNNNSNDLLFNSNKRTINTSTNLTSLTPSIISSDIDNFSFINNNIYNNNSINYNYDSNMNPNSLQLISSSIDHINEKEQLELQRQQLLNLESEPPEYLILP